MVAGRRRRRGPGEAGQASVELVAIVPLLVLVTVAACQLLAAGAARELAGNAAEAGAAAMLQGGDPTDAARKALPGWSGHRVRITVRGRDVRVRLRPPTVLPGTASVLEADEHADAGPTPSAAARRGLPVGPRSPHPLGAPALAPAATGSRPDSSVDSRWPA